MHLFPFTPQHFRTLCVSAHVQSHCFEKLHASAKSVSPSLETVRLQARFSTPDACERNFVSLTLESCPSVVSRHKIISEQNPSKHSACHSICFRSHCFPTVYQRISRQNVLTRCACQWISHHNFWKCCACQRFRITFLANIRPGSAFFSSTPKNVTPVSAFRITILGNVARASAFRVIMSQRPAPVSGSRVITLVNTVPVDRFASQSLQTLPLSEHFVLLSLEILHLSAHFASPSLETLRLPAHFASKCFNALRLSADFAFQECCAC